MEGRVVRDGFRVVGEMELKIGNGIDKIKLRVRWGN